VLSLPRVAPPFACGKTRAVFLMHAPRLTYGLTFPSVVHT
jgi:hypothetical protein